LPYQSEDRNPPHVSLMAGPDEQKTAQNYNSEQPTRGIAHGLDEERKGTKRTKSHTILLEQEILS